MIGVILLNMGGPDSLDAVKPFLQNLFADRDIIRLGPAFLQKPIASLIINLRLKKTIELYSLIGGKSPLAEITSTQAKALEKALNIKIYVGMRYWHPFIYDTLKEMKRDGVTKVLALSLYPQYSVATTGSTVKMFETAIKGQKMEYACITSWFDHSGYIDALVEKIEEGLKGFDEKPVVLFSAHSLPQRFIDEGDPYCEHINKTIIAISKKIDMDWRLSFQSKTGPVKWLEPSTEAMLETLAGEKKKNVLVVPISFVSDHIETLYEIDILYKNMAKGLGINLKRTESLNVSATFINALADIVITKTKELNWL
ncbi:MAG: ferrochelatase [Nitrospirae bacterium]|nr:MAG: ferrochelatase [Nitrospirota bacterium]